MIELLNRYGLKSTFNLNSALLSAGGILSRSCGRVAHYKIRREDVRSVYEGHEIAVHTLTHPLLTQLEEAEIVHQVEDDRLHLSELAGYEVVGMAYPCGGVNNDDRVAEIIKTRTGVRYSRTITTNGRFDLQENLFRFDPTVFHLDFDKMMALGREFVEMKTDRPQIFYIWGHAFEMDYASDHWVRLEEFFKLISGKDDIFYGTNQEVLL